MGMVESALEFIRICRDLDFHDTVLSMKASNTQVMVQAYRLLVKMMNDEGMNYPLHLGVTEAGEAKDGRIKSAVGIGTLLEDGLGDTIRVSLTEEPEKEIPVARSLIERYSNGIHQHIIDPIKELPYDPYFRQMRKTNKVLNIGKNEVTRVVGDLSDKPIIKPTHLVPFGYVYSAPNDKWHIVDQAADYLYVGKSKIDFEIPGTLSIIQDIASWSGKPKQCPIMDVQNFLEAESPDYVVIAAAKVGGIQSNNIYRAEFLYDNIMIESNLIHYSYFTNFKVFFFHFDNTFFLYSCFGIAH